MPSTTFSKGAVISSQFNFQNWSIINRFMSGIIGGGLDFTETFKRFIKNRDKKIFDRFVAKEQLDTIWNDFTTIFNYRHEMAHSMR